MDWTLIFSKRMVAMIDRPKSHDEIRRIVRNLHAWWFIWIFCAVAIPATLKYIQDREEDQQQELQRQAVILKNQDLMIRNQAIITEQMHKIIESSKTASETFSSPAITRFEKLIDKVENLED